jgi:aspartyl-tRNA(Asn)/glutamyl-tRNA(Gln) amidotransferase subunit C
MSTLSRSEVEKIARLARLELTDEELETYRGQLSAILDYEARIGELNLDGVEPTAGAYRLQNVMRDDVIEPSLPLEDALHNAAARASNQFLIQAVLDE